VYRTFLFRMRNISYRICKKIKTHILCSITVFFFRKSCCLWDNVENYCRTERATDDNTVLAHCMLDTYGYKKIFRICYTYCFIATMVVRTRLNVALYVHCLYFVSVFIALQSLFLILLIHCIWHFLNATWFL